MPLLVVAAVLAACGFVHAAEPISSAAWKLERLELVDGRTLSGFIDDEGEHETIAFTEIVRRPGRGMYLVARSHLGRDRVRSIERLPAEAHEELAARVREFRDRGLARKRAEDAVRLVRDEVTGRLRYDGEAFAVESSAADPVTREAIVRLEQLFAAFETVLPAGGDDRETLGAERLQVRICGTDAEYRDVQRSLGVAVANPAIFVPAKRLLVAGGEFPAVVEEHETATESLAAAELDLATRAKGLEPLLRELVERLERQGVPSAQRAEIVQRARARHRREHDEAAERIASARRGNGQRLAVARRVFHERLAHEAWHTHAVRLAASTAGGRPIPVWLDEGLAQVFETAVLEVGDLRLDAADPARLDRLARLLAAGERGRIAEVLRLESKAFLVGHDGRREVSEQAYLVAWGLALHLAMLEPVLDRAAVRRLTESSDPTDPVGQLEAVVGMPLETFEPVWRARLLSLAKSPPRR